MQTNESTSIPKTSILLITVPAAQTTPQMMVLMMIPVPMTTVPTTTALTMTVTTKVKNKALTNADCEDSLDSANQPIQQRA